MSGGSDEIIHGNSSEQVVKSMSVVIEHSTVWLGGVRALSYLLEVITLERTGQNDTKAHCDPR